MGARLRAGALERFALAYPPDAAAAAAAAAPHFAGRGAARPFLTLKRPLGAGEVRRLNLFEHRWVALLDGYADGSGLVGKAIFTVHAPGRCAVGGAGDVVVDARTARAAVVEAADESARPVSGDRRVALVVRGADEPLEARGLAATAAGWLVGEPAPRTAAAADGAGGPATVVAVVGLAHANPVLRRCADRGLRVGT